MPNANEESIYKILTAENDLIPPIVAVKSAEILSKALTNVMNTKISMGIFPSNAKLASAKPIYRKGSKLDIQLQTNQC